MGRDDIVVGAASAAALAAYHAFLSARRKRDPSFTVQQTNAHVRERWVEVVLKQGKDILAVQTLRNATMAATFLASTSVVLILGILNIVGKGDVMATSLGPKLVLVLLDLFIAFFAFSMAVRVYNHAGFILGLGSSVGDGPLTPHQVAIHLNRAAGFYSAGMRSFYFLGPLVFWLFGPWTLAAATLVLIPLLYFNDRAPAGSTEK